MHTLTFELPYYGEQISKKLIHLLISMTMFEYTVNLY